MGDFICEGFNKIPTVSKPQSRSIERLRGWKLILSSRLRGFQGGAGTLLGTIGAIGCSASSPAPRGTVLQPVSEATSAIAANTANIIRLNIVVPRLLQMFDVAYGV